MFFQVDDKFHSHRKVMAMLEVEGYARAAQAVTLWTLAGSLSRDAGLDGLITLGQAARVTTDRAAAKRAAALLVKHDLWHAPGHTCERCPPVPEGAFLFHDWFQFGYGTGEAERTAVAKRKELRDPGVVEAVWARDTGPDGRARCRYCEHVVRRPTQRGGDRRSTMVGQLDHIDPTRAIGASNIIVTCGDCNRRKAQRTPEQAGMTLLPAPASINARINPDQRTDQSGSTHGSIGSTHGSNLGSKREVGPPRARARAGAGGVGDGSGGGVGGQGPGAGGVGRAGPAPEVPVPAAFGSPWKGHHGPPPPPNLIEDATCPEHDQPRPCRVCAAIDRGEG